MSTVVLLPMHQVALRSLLATYVRIGDRYSSSGFQGGESAVEPSAPHPSGDESSVRLNPLMPSWKTLLDGYLRDQGSGPSHACRVPGVDTSGCNDDDRPKCYPAISWASSIGCLLHPPMQAAPVPPIHYIHAVGVWKTCKRLVNSTPRLGKMLNYTTVRKGRFFVLSHLLKHWFHIIRC